MAEERIIQIEVLRYRPERDSEPVPETFEVPFVNDTSVLEGIQYIKDQLDGSLTFRWSCRMAICGSCGMMLNGIPKLACSTFLRDYYPGPLRVEALEHFPIEKDLVIDASSFMEKLEGMTPYIVPAEEKSLDEGEYLQTPEQKARYDQFSACINCMLCYAACPQNGLNPNYTGPGVIALIQRYNADSRDAANDKRMEILNSEDGVWSCTLVGYCSVVCPKGVDPAKAINMNKVNSTIDYFRRLVSPGGAAKQAHHDR